MKRTRSAGPLRSSPQPRIYLDHASATPMLPEVRTAIDTASDHWANPSSIHFEGRVSRSMLDCARLRIARAFDWIGPVIFTSGATEAIDIVFRRARFPDCILSSVEHSAVLRCAPNARRIAVSGDGRLDLNDLQAALRSCRGPLVAVQSVNNETGVIHPLEEVAKLVSEAGGLLLADCAPSAGKLPLPNADFVAVAAHKMGGPPGVGALLVRDLDLLGAVGGQEFGMRPGTPSVPMIAGFAAGTNMRGAPYELLCHTRGELDRTIKLNGGEVIAEAAPRIATIASYRMPGVSAQIQVARFDAAGIAVSAGNAFATGTSTVSHVLTAMGMSEPHAREVIRVSFGHGTTAEDVSRFVDAWRDIHDELGARPAGGRAG